MMDILACNVHNSVIADTTLALKLQEYVLQKGVSEDGGVIRAVRVG